jgi:hypothetical protein
MVAEDCRGIVKKMIAEIAVGSTRWHTAAIHGSNILVCSSKVVDGLHSTCPIIPRVTASKVQRMAGVARDQNFLGAALKLVFFTNTAHVVGG